MVTIIEKDIFDVKTDILCHQVNCHGAMNSGIARQIRVRYPKVYNNYMTYTQSLLPQKLLGRALVVKVSDDLSVCNLFGQDFYGTDRRYTNYEALAKGFESLNRRFPGKTISIPYGLGCGLGGGNWNIVLAIITESLKDCNVLICKKPEERD